MATSPIDEDGPPPYVTENHNEAEELVQPVILVLVGQSIRAQTADGTPMYELSRDIQRTSTSEGWLAQVSLERLVHSVRVSANGNARVSHRNKHIFDLKHLPPVLSTGYPYCLDAISRNTMGNLALKPASFPRSGFKVVRIKPEKEDGFPKGYHARRESLKEGDVIFEVVKKRNHYEWVQSDGDRIALEDEAEDEHRLIVTTPVTRKMMDAMIGSWCLKVWRDSIKSNSDPMKSVRKEVRSGREVLPRFW
ncbi:hypothetical protein F5Y04DRAFT_187292 [Hypomontagnella monticulosa]|nr:hypothetical protein F5Y04DRAFT_187292 [Hypomontagnella monticulosa]